LALAYDRQNRRFDRTRADGLPVHSPRFAAEARAANMALVDLLERIAEDKHATPAQIALACLMAQRPWIVPIPGTTKQHRLEENLGATSVELSSDNLPTIGAAASAIPIQGARLPDAILVQTGH
jgi:aryl-alcohol dehydrogenase-like predicted oxidoreductase